MLNLPFHTVPPVELWGGLECTINRVHDRYADQLHRSGHYDRPDDLERLAALGIRTLRYPLLWEHLAGAYTDPPWQWADGQMHQLSTLGIRPVVGLLHHGSGPPHTSLLDAGFANGLAHHAARVARRYPWIDAYTPVNEPLTTARFSGLYGWWYPHQTSDGAFVRMLLNQCRATVLAMRAIRRVNPNAQLVQTEDLGYCHSTPLLAQQANFENRRRWLSFDLLRGEVTTAHPLYRYLTRAGATEADLGFFQENPCPPDLIGVNYYLTSQRYLDERLWRYPAHLHGGNGRQAYADVEAVRVPEVQPLLPDELFTQVWQRYHTPFIISEVHLGGNVSQQMRWFHQVWRAAQRLRAQQVPIRAVTAWALLGSFDWNTLLTAEEGYYEPGAFALNENKPRLTALGRMLRELATHGRVTVPDASLPGWWQHPERWNVEAVVEEAYLDK